MKIAPWLLAVTTSAVAFQASASGNTINFVGEVAENTCSVTVNENSASPIVLLPTVSAAELAVSTSVAGRTEFEVALTDCDFTGVTNISSVFVGNNVTTDGNLGNTGTAENVELQIMKDESTPINLAVGPVTTSFTDSPYQEGDSASQTYYVQYYSLGEAGAGTVLGSMQYAINYQ